MKSRTSILVIGIILHLLLFKTTLHANDDTTSSAQPYAENIHLDVKEKLPLVITKLEHCRYKGSQVTDNTHLLSAQALITFHPIKEYLKIHFNLLGRSDKKPTYLYKVDNIQDNWIVLRNKYLSIYQLPYGEHNVRIKAVDDQGIDIGNILMIPVKIVKPFYLTAKFIVPFFMILGVVFFFIIYRNKRIKEAFLTQQQNIKAAIYTDYHSDFVDINDSNIFYFENVLNRLQLIYSDFSTDHSPQIILKNRVPEHTQLNIDQNKLIDILNTMIYHCYKKNNKTIQIVTQKNENQIYILVEEDQPINNKNSFFTKLHFFNLFSSRNKVVIDNLEQSINELGGIFIKKSFLTDSNSFLISIPTIKNHSKVTDTYPELQIEQPIKPNTVSTSQLPTTLSLAEPAVNNESQELSWQNIQWLNKLDHLILENLNNNQFNTEYLADLMRISRRQLHRRLKNTLNVTPKDYIKEKRLTQAKLYLEERKFLKIKDVAQSVGFKEASYFSQLYTKRFDENPSKYFTS